MHVKYLCNCLIKRMLKLALEIKTEYVVALIGIHIYAITCTSNIYFNST